MSQRVPFQARGATASVRDIAAPSRGAHNVRVASKRARKHLLLAAASTLASVAVAEFAVRVLGLAPDDRPMAASTPEPGAGAKQPQCVVTDTPELYALNPRHPDVGPSGLRGGEVTMPKPAGTFRVLVLGDSIAFGYGVDEQASFPRVLEQRLRDRSSDFDVVNSGVPGYSAYNELQWYLHRGRSMAPDLVVVTLCLNDVVNPRLHWGTTAGLLIVVPDEAIPNLQFDRAVVRPALAKQLKIAPERLTRREPSVLDSSALFRFVRQRMTSRAVDPVQAELQRERHRAGPSRTDVLTMLTGEDTLSIEVLVEADSPERRWLDGIYGQLRDAVEADGAALVVVMVPLSYQLDADYPFVPQRDMASRWNDAGLPCLDLLPALRRGTASELFLLDRDGRQYDIWHPTEAGHERIADELLRFLDARDLLR